MVHILMCDDDAAALKSLDRMVADYYGGRCRTALFTDPGAAAEHFMRDPRVDLALLDILMPQMSGTQLAQRLRDSGYGGEIAFLTSSNEYAAESYEVGAMHYLLKPYAAPAVRTLLDRFEAKQAQGRRGIDIIRKNIARRILFRDLTHVEVIQHHLHFHLAGGELLRIYAPLSDYQEALLAHEIMAQCHRSYIVNMDYVDLCTATEVVLSDRTRISVTDKYRSFQDRYLQYTFGRMDR